MRKSEFTRTETPGRSPWPTRSLAILGCVLALGWLTASCKRASEVNPLPPGVIAVVGDQTISLTQFEAVLSRRGIVANPAAQQAVLAELIGNEAAALKAEAAGYVQRPEVRAEFKRLLADRFREDQLAKSAPRQPTELEIAEYYQTNAARFTTPERVRGAILYLNVPTLAPVEKAGEVRARAERIRASATQESGSEVSFARLVQQYSEDQATRYRGGDLGFLTARELEQRVGRKVAAALLDLRQPGEVGPVVEGPHGLYLVRLIAREPEQRRPLAEVREGITYHLVRSKEANLEREFYASCTNGLVVRINQSLLDSVRVPHSPSTPPALPSSLTASAK